MKKAFFVTGTDTEVGKTTISAALLYKAADLGLTTLGLKPVASGAMDTADGPRNEDGLALAEAATEKLPYQQVNPILFTEAIAPHIAARHEGRKLTSDRLAGFCQGAMLKGADFTLVEGAGGWRVPLNDHELLSRLPWRLKLPVILVVGVKLGAINHALLTAEAVMRDGLELAGWVANCVDPQMACLDENLQTLQALMPAPCLGVVPFVEGGDSRAMAECLDLSPLAD